MRTIVALIAVAALVAAAAFFADHPGQVQIAWQDWQIDTSVGVLIIVLVLLVLLLSGLAGLVAALLRLPRTMRRRRHERRRRAGEAAMTRGLVALAAGNPAEAQLQAYRAEKLLERSAVPLLLAAEAAERQGDKAVARRYFAALSERPDAAFIGLRGLLALALREGQTEIALRLAERAQRLRPDVPWVTETLLRLQARAGQWDAARDTLAAARRRGVMPAARVRHHRGVVLYELSGAAERRGARREAAALAAQAQVQAPDLAAIACHHAQLLHGIARSRAAARAMERAWRSAPHPDLAHTYLEIHPEVGPLERATLLQRLAAQHPDGAESHLVLAEAALAAQLWGEARRHLNAVAAGSGPSGPSRRLCLMMARLEESDGDGAFRAREWRDRALSAAPDPCYICAACGVESGEWHSLCPRCGDFDTLAWRAPDRADIDGGARSAASVLPLMLPGPDAPLIEPGAAKAFDRLGSATTIR
jgi:HemY protein